MKNILVEEAYTGVLNNHRREYNNGKANGKHNMRWPADCNTRKMHIIMESAVENALQSQENAIFSAKLA